MYYVSMIDKAFTRMFSGMLKGRLNRLVFECATLQEAETVVDNGDAREDMKNVAVHVKSPYFTPKRNVVQVKTREEYPNWYKPGWFRN